MHDSRSWPPSAFIVSFLPKDDRIRKVPGFLSLSHDQSPRLGTVVSGCTYGPWMTLERFREMQPHMKFARSNLGASKNASNPK